MGRCLIYALVDPRTDEVRYIGKSSRGERRMADHGLDCHLRRDRTHKGKWIRALRADGRDYAVRVLEHVAEERNLNAAEIHWIAYGRAQGWRLTNHTDGGEGIRNPVPETRAKMAANARARNSIAALQTPESRAKAKAALKGLPKSPETRALMSELARRRFEDPEQRAKISRGRMGTKMPPRSPEQRAKISAALRGKPKPYMAERNRAVEWTDEMRRKVGAARRANTANPPNAIYVESTNGERKTIREWARASGQPYPRLRYRIVDLQWPIERAIAAQPRGVRKVA